MPRTQAITMRHFSLGLCLLAAGCSGCPPKAQPGGPGDVTTLDSPKCPEHLVGWNAVDSSGESHHITQIPAAGDAAISPELHDCQRLIHADERGGRSYGALGAIFASSNLDSLFTGRAAISGEPLRAAATVYVAPEAGTNGYPTLRLPPGWSCVYVLRSRVNDRWEYIARVMPIKGAELQLCNEPADPDRVYPAVLQVAATPLADLGELDRADLALSAARWDDNFLHDGRSQHISLRCGEAWCDILPIDADGPVEYTPPADLPPDARTSLPGWYDRQLLAVPDPEHPGKLMPGPTHVAYFPVAKLRDRQMDAFLDTWQATGYIVLPEPSATYAEKLGLAPGVNTVALRQGAYPGPGEGPKCQPTEDQPKHDASQWWAQVASSAGESRTFCSYRHEHPPGMLGAPMDGAVRWRWLDDDEKTWQYCTQGCCPIS